MFFTFYLFQTVLRAVYAVLTHDISSRICDVALNILDCLLQLGVVPSATKKASKCEDKVAEHTKEGVSPSMAGAHGVFSGGTAAVSGGGSGDGDGGESGGGNDMKNNKFSKVHSPNDAI